MKQQRDAPNESVHVCVLLVHEKAPPYFFFLHVGTSSIKSIKSKQVMNRQTLKNTETDSNASELK